MQLLHAGEYDLAGFIVGVMEREREKDQRVKPAICCWRSFHRLHTTVIRWRANSYSSSGLQAETYVAEVSNKSGGIVTPHRCYWQC